MLYVEEIPKDINELKKQARNKLSYKKRLDAVEELGKYKCQQSQDILWRRMVSDKIYLVKLLSFKKLQAFGIPVSLPKKKRGVLVKDINKKLFKIRESFKEDFTIEQFKSRFLELYPEDFDIYSYEKDGQKMDVWIKNILSTGSLKSKYKSIEVPYSCELI